METETKNSGSAAEETPAAKGDAKGVIILGATSGIARAVATEFARRGYSLVLASRDPEENELIARDLRVRCCVNAAAVSFDAENYESHPAFVEECCGILGDGLEGVVLCFGYLPDQTKAQRDFALVRRTVDVNLSAAISVLELFARFFEERAVIRRKFLRNTKSVGFICAISSVAGDRGRQSIYIYGAAKAGLSAYLQGLRNRLYRSGVSVIAVKPGPIDTKMTFGLPSLPFLASAEKAGKIIVNGILKRRATVYVPGLWRYVMMIIRALPEPVFNRMKL